MMNVQTVSTAACWQPQTGHHALKLANDGRWSTLNELQDLLRYEKPPQSTNDGELFQRRRLKVGDSALMMGQQFDGLYVVRLGTLKTMITHADGGVHVLAFPMKGSLLGFDGIYQNAYTSDVVALTDCDLVRIPAAMLFASGRMNNHLEHMAYWASSREIIQEQEAYSLTRSVRSEARVARFLHAMSQRFDAMGYSPNRFILSMTRRDIGHHLSVTVETVSRAFSALVQQGIISVDFREIKILSRDALRNFER